MCASRADALGQILLIGLDDDRWNSAMERLLAATSPGGILLARRHLRNPESASELLRKLSLAVSAPPFLALEEEGGAVDPLRAIFPPLPPPRAVWKKGAAAIARLGELAGAGLKLLGFNTNFAPVLDLSTPCSEPVLGARTFAADPREVARCGRAFVRGLRRQKVLPCGKHFPGLGSARVGDQSGLRLSEKTMAELWREDLVPYRELLTQLPMVMVGHGAYKAYDFDLPLPAVLSENVVEGLLRVKLGYRGVAVADDLDREEVCGGPEPGDAALRSFNAGCDLLFVGCREKFITHSLAGLKRGAESGGISTRRLEQALERMRSAKKGLAPPSGKVLKSTCVELARKIEDFSKYCRPVEQEIA